MWSEAKQIQQLLLKDALDPKLKPYIRAGIARAYKELAELRLRLQGKGPPKAVDYGDRRKQRKQPINGFTEVPHDAKAQLPNSGHSVNDNER